MGCKCESNGCSSRRRNAMGYGTALVERATVEGQRVSEKEVWKAMGNAIHASVLCHTIVSWLITKGYITRDDPRLKGQPWTVNYDGPWRELLRQAQQRLEARRQNQSQAGSRRELQREGQLQVRVTHKVLEVKLEAAVVHNARGWREMLHQAARRVEGRDIAVEEEGMGGVEAMPEVQQEPAAATLSVSTTKRQRLSGVKRGLEMARSAAPSGQLQMLPPTWKSVYAHCDAKGVPCMQVMSRARGDIPQRRPGQEFWQFVDSLAMDLMVMSRAESTWRQYAAWFGVFEEFRSIMECSGEDVTMAQLCGVLVRSLAILFYTGKYVPKTLELYVTAISSTLQDMGMGCVRADPSVQRQLEGIKRSMGVSVQKKLAIEGVHIAGWLKMEVPPNDGKAWTGRHSHLQWKQFVGVAVLAWSCFLRVSEVVGMQLCDLKLVGAWLQPRHLEVLVRHAKADQRGVSTTTVMDAAHADSAVCLLRVFLDHLAMVHGMSSGEWRSPGCTRARFKNRKCACCPYVFPKVSVRGVERMAVTSDRLMRTRMKAAMFRLVELGLVSEEDVARFSMISFRRGGNSVAAAMGVRARVRSDHGRWGLAGLVEKGLTCEVDYNSTLARDGGAVMKALNGDVNQQLQGIWLRAPSSSVVIDSFRRS